MEEIQVTKSQIRSDIADALAALSEKEIVEKTKAVEKRLFDFANFLEAKVALMYVNNKNEVATNDILKRTHVYNKIIVLPAYNTETYAMTLMKVDSLEKDLSDGPRGILEPNSERCKVVPIDSIDIAIIPGLAFDEKGGRIGTGNGFFDQFIPKLPITARKVSLAFEDQMVQQIPMESHDKYVDIIITEKRIIYKI